MVKGHQNKKHLLYTKCCSNCGFKAYHLVYHSPFSVTELLNRERNANTHFSRRAATWPFIDTLALKRPTFTKWQSRFATPSSSSPSLHSKTSPEDRAANKILHPHSPQKKKRGKQKNESRARAGDVSTQCFEAEEMRGSARL